MMRLRNILICLTAALGAGLSDAGAQHTLTAVAGTGISTARFYPDEETRTLWGAHDIGVSWRYYSPTPRFVGAMGADLEYIRRGFSLGYTYTTEIVDDKEIRNYEYYTRRINTLMLPLVWQPHFYMARNHLRFYIEAAVFFSYNMSSTYVYDDNPSKGGGDYPYKSVRDNRLGYGLALLAAVRAGGVRPEGALLVRILRPAEKPQQVLRLCHRRAGEPVLLLAAALAARQHHAVDNARLALQQGRLRLMERQTREAQPLPRGIQIQP